MSPDDRNRADRGMDRGADDRGFSDRNSFAEDLGLDRDLEDRGVEDRGFSDRNLAAAAGMGAAASDRELEDRNLSSADRGFEDRDLEEMRAESGSLARRNASPLRPSPIWAAELRERMVTRLETQRPPLFPFALGQRVARVVPVSIAALLFAVAMVGAAQLNIGAPDPSESPVAATDDASPSQPIDPSLEPLPTGGQPIVPVVTPPPAPDATPNAPAPPPPPPPPPPPGPATLRLSLKGCDGGVVITWSKYKGGDFNHYTTLRNTTSNVPLAYPPQGGAVDFGGTYTTDVTALSAVDATGAPPTTYYYRAMAFNAADQVVGASAIVSAAAMPMASLGSVGVAPDAGGTLITWNPYGGHPACFTWYKVVASTTNPNPSYLNGDPYVYVGSGQGESGTVVTDLVSGQTYYIRVQAIRSTAIGLFVAGQTDVATYLVP